MRTIRINGRLSVSAQPDLAAFAAFAAEGYIALINVRPDGEEPDQPGNAAEKAAAAAAGLSYSFVPVTGAAGITEADIDAFQDAAGSGTGPVLAQASNLRSWRHSPPSARSTPAPRVANIKNSAPISNVGLSGGQASDPKHSRRLRAGRTMIARAGLAALGALIAATAQAEPPFINLRCACSYEILLERVHKAIEANGMKVIAEASPTATAAAQGFTIPGDTVAMVFRNDFARRM